MTNHLDRRVAKLEAAASAASDVGNAVHVAFVHPGENAEAKVAALGRIRRGDQVIVVCFKNPGDVPRAGEAVH